MKNRLRNGITLVELLVAMAILSIVLLWVAHFMLTSSNLFSSENAAAATQNEVQLVSNQISDMLKSTQLGISYGICENADIEFVLEDDGRECRSKYLYIFNWNSEYSLVNVRVIKWVAEEQKLYYTELKNVANKTASLSAGDGVSDSILESVNTEGSVFELLGENIAAFSVSMSDYNVLSTIDITIGAERQGKSYENTFTTKLRNNIILNADNISEIYEQAGGVVSTVIKSISVSAPGSSTIPSGKIQLSTNVSGEGYPSQIIYKWKIVKVSGGTETETVYDSLTAKESGTNVNPSTKILTVDEDMEATILRIYAYANTRSSDEDYVKNTVSDISKVEYVYYAGGTIKTILIYDYCDISIRDITSFTIRPVPDLSLEANQSLSGLVNDFSAITVTSHNEAADTGVMDVYPGNVIQMEASVIGTYLSEQDKQVVWTITELNSDIDVYFSSGGVLTIGKYSKPGRCLLTAKSVLDEEMTLSYLVNIGDVYAEGNNMLEIDCPATLNRASKTQLGLKLNGETVPTEEFSNFQWSYNLTNTAGSKITNSSTTVSSGGLVSVASNLSYDYAYRLAITVSMKNNSAIYATVVAVIPKISIELTSESYISKRGRTIAEGEITANVTGIEQGNYNLQWSLATETNPNSFAAAYGTGTNVTGGSNNSCRVVISGSESEALTYMRLKVTIAGHTNYYALCRIVLADVSMTVSSDKNVIERTDDGSSKVSFTASSPQTGLFSAGEISWDIISVSVGGRIISNTNGLCLSKNGTGATLYALKSFYPSSEKITVTVRAKWSGITADKEITISPVDFSIGGDGEIDRGETLTYTVNNTYGGNIEWSAETTGGSYQNITIVPTGERYASCTLYVSPFFDTDNNEDDYITLTAKLKNSTLSVAYKVSVNQVRISLAATSVKNQYKATVTGIGSADIYWGLASSSGGTVYSSLTGITASFSESLATLSYGTGAPINFWLYAQASYGGAYYKNAGISYTKLMTVNFSSTPDKLSYGSTYYTCNYKKATSGRTTYYKYSMRGPLYNDSTNDIRYYKTQAGTGSVSRNKASYSYSGSYTYYAYTNSTWFVWSGSEWTEVSSTATVGTTGYNLITVLSGMVSNKSLS